MTAYKKHFARSAVASGLFAVAPAWAQAPQEIAPLAAEGEDFEVEVEAEDTQPSSTDTTTAPPAEAPPTGAPPAPPAPAPAAAPKAAVPKGIEPSETALAPKSTSPAATSVAAPAPAQGAETAKSTEKDTSKANAKQPSFAQSLLLQHVVSEGSNYRKALRLGFNLRGFVQVQLQGSQLSEDELDADGESLNAFTFALRRARIGVEHGWKYAHANLEIDASTVGEPAVRVRRAEASLLYRGSQSDNVTPPLVLTAGVTDIPFGYELGQSQRDRLFMEQSLPSRAIFPTPADLGAKLWGAYGWAEYSVAVVNGEPQEHFGVPEDKNVTKDLALRVGASTAPSKRIRLGGGTSAYLGKGFSPGQPATKDSIQWIDLNNNGVADAGEIIGTTGSSAIESANYSRYAIGIDAEAAVEFPLGTLDVGGEAFVASNMDRGVLPNDPIVTGVDSQQFGAAFYAVQGLTSFVALGARASYYDPNSNLLELRAAEFHLKNQSYWEFSPSVAFTLDRARLSAQYDFIWDHLGRDPVGVPTDVANNEWTLRLQVDL